MMTQFSYFGWITPWWNAPQVWGRGWGVCAAAPGSEGCLCRSTEGKCGLESWSRPSFHPPEDGAARIWQHKDPEMIISKFIRKCLVVESMKNWTGHMIQGMSTHLLIWDLEQVQHHSVSSHVLQQPLLLHTNLLSRRAEFTETQQDLCHTRHKTMRPALHLEGILLCMPLCNIQGLYSLERRKHWVKKFPPLSQFCSCWLCCCLFEVYCSHPALGSRYLLPVNQKLHTVRWHHRYWFSMTDTDSDYSHTCYCIHVTHMQNYLILISALVSLKYYLYTTRVFIHTLISIY